MTAFGAIVCGCPKSAASRESSSACFTAIINRGIFTPPLTFPPFNPRQFGQQLSSERRTDGSYRANERMKRTAAEKAEKRRRRQEYMTSINGKQKRVRRPPTIDGMDVDEFIRRNADPIWLHQNEMWEHMEPIPAEPWQQGSKASPERQGEGKHEPKLDLDYDEDIPF
jgi:hypothetical protein